MDTNGLVACTNEKRQSKGLSEFPRRRVCSKLLIWRCIALLQEISTHSLKGPLKECTDRVR
eukprot:5648041-Pleurochrysis_carterae.AAC.2